MKTIGICGGAPVTVTFDTTIAYIGVDKGIETLLAQGIQPCIGVGDFDSIEQPDVLQDLKITCLPTRKDITDTHYAVLYAVEQGYQRLQLYGVTGGRIDHYMAVLCLLQSYRDIEIIIYDEQNEIQLLPAGKHRIYKSKYTYFSLFTYQTTEITITSCEYPLTNYRLTKEDPLCVSNQIQGAYCDIETTEDIIFIQSRDKK